MNAQHVLDGEMREAHSSVRRLLKANGEPFHDYSMHSTQAWGLSVEARANDIARRRLEEMPPIVMPHECNRFGWFLMGAASGVIVLVCAMRGWPF